MMVKCVIWDIDNTLLSGVVPGVAAAAAARRPGHARGAAQLRDRGIIHAIASRNPPEAAQYAAAGHRPGLRGRGVRLGPQVGRACGGSSRTLASRPTRWRSWTTTLRAGRGLVRAARGAGAVAGGHGRRGRLAGVQPRGGDRRSPPPRRDVRGSGGARQEEARAFGGSQGRVPAHRGTQVTIAPATAGRRAAPARAVGPHAPVQLDRRGRDRAGAGGADQRRRAPGRGRPAGDRFGDDGLVGGCVIAAAATAPGR